MTFGCAIRSSCFLAYGSVADKLLPRRPDVPNFVALPYTISDGSVTPGQHASFLGKMHDPLLVTEDPNASDFRLPELSLPAGVSPERLQQRRELQALVDRQLRVIDQSVEARNLDATYARAMALLTSDKVKKAFDLSAEKKETRDRYGRTTYGQSLLLARRLVEAEVKFVNVYFSQSIGGQSFTEGGWEHAWVQQYPHVSIIEKNHLPITEQTLPTFLLDLEERGLLDTTLVVWSANSAGRRSSTPRQAAITGRNATTALLAGGGVKRVTSTAQATATARTPRAIRSAPMIWRQRCSPRWALEPENEVRDAQQRPLAIAGQVVRRCVRVRWHPFSRDAQRSIFVARSSSKERQKPKTKHGEMEEIQSGTEK